MSRVSRLARGGPGGAGGERRLLGLAGVLVPFLLPTVVAADIVTAGGEFRVNTYTTLDQLGRGSTFVCGSARGDFVIVWDDTSADGGAVLGQRFDSAGVRQGDEFHVNTYTTLAQLHGSIACDAAGRFVVVWTSAYQDGSFGGVFAQRYASDGMPVGSEFQVNTYTPGQQIFPAVGVDASGNFVVTWADGVQDGSAFGVFGRRFGSDGVALGTEFQVNTYTTGEQLGTVLAVAASGDFLVAWRSVGQDGDGNGVFGQRYAFTGDPVGTEFQMNAYTTGSQSVGGLSVDGNGDYVVVWSSFVSLGSQNGGFARRFSSTGVPLGTEFLVNTYTTFVPQEPRVAADADGDLVFVWSSGGQDGSGSGILAQRYDSSGARHGSEFIVNSYTTGQQGDASSVAADADGDFVIVWNSAGQDGDAFGVFAQRYQDPCGDGAVGAGEECDVGDRRPGGCCSPTCQTIAAGTACPDDGVACTADVCDASATCVHVPNPAACAACNACDPSFGCVPRPRSDCRHPRRASLALVNRTRDARDRLAFAWKQGGATTTAELGNPPTSPDYTLCVFDRQGGEDRLVLREAAPAGAGWRRRGGRGFRFRGRAGLTRVAVKSGGDGKALATVAGKGAGLALPGLGLTPPVEAQLEVGRDGVCFAGTFPAPKRNTATRFRAKGD